MNKLENGNEIETKFDMPLREKESEREGERAENVNFNNI